MKRNSLDTSSSSSSSPASPATSPNNRNSTNSDQTKKGTSISQTLQAMRRSSKTNPSGSTGSGSTTSPPSNRASINNSLKRSDKEAIQDELSEYPRHKYQTIQSFRPEEVKELLAQHFMKINSDTQTNRSSPIISEDGKRRFFHLKPARRSGSLSGDGDLSDSSSLSGEDSGNNLRAFVSMKQDHQRASLKEDEISSPGTEGSSGSRDPSLRLSRKDTYLLSNYGVSSEKDKAIADLKEQLSRERRINSDQLNKMRAKQKKLKAKMVLQQEKLDALILVIEGREHNVQAKLMAALENE